MNDLEISMPSIRLDIYLVEHGFQADFIIEGGQTQSIVRSFADSYNVEDIRPQLVAALYLLLDGTRKFTKPE